MLDLKYIRHHPEQIRIMIEQRGEAVDLDRLLATDARWRTLQVELDELRQRHNTISKQIAQRRKQGRDVRSLIDDASVLAEQVEANSRRTHEAQGELDELLLTVPNMPHPDTPAGQSEAENTVVRTWREPGTPDFAPLPHWEIAEQLGLLDVDRGAKIAGSNFPVLKGSGARLERALINLMLDVHTQRHGYQEIAPPALANRPTMTGTGQLPKLDDEMYRCERDDLFLIPTGEVPLTNLHADEILPCEWLPLRYTAVTPCFRREAGSHGRDTRGLTRVHQFNKVELVKFVVPETSDEEHASLLRDAEGILRLLELPYRVVRLCTAELSFAAAICDDLEVWAAGQERYLEVSSCSHFGDFQARRANIRFRRNRGAKVEYVHTLNASGLALPRTLIALLENRQRSDGRIEIPEALRPYMGGMALLE